MDYNSWSHDFKLPGSSSGCAPCGGNTGISTELHSVQVHRYLRTRLGNHGLNSFGRISAMVGYDVSLRWNENGLKSDISFYEAGSVNALSALKWQSDRMAWAPADSADVAFGLSLFDVSGNPINALANRELAHTGVFLKANGSSVHFEIIRKGNTIYGRPVAFADRNGNLTDVAYIDAQPAFGSDVSTVREYFRRTKITDPYNRELNFEYTFIGYGYFVTKITHPDGQFTTYSYKGLGSHGRVIHRVNHPDGSVSTNDWNLNPATGLRELSMFEATAVAGKRRKTVFTSSYSGPTSNGVTIATVPGLARMVKNGAGEMNYANRSSSTGDRIVYEGGNKSFSVKILNSTKGLAGFKEIKNGAALKNTFFSADLNSLTQTKSMSRVNSSKWRQSSSKDALGREKRTPTRNAISKNPHSYRIP